MCPPKTNRKTEHSEKKMSLENATLEVTRYIPPDGRFRMGHRVGAQSARPCLSAAAVPHGETAFFVSEHARHRPRRKRDLEGDGGEAAARDRANSVTDGDEFRNR